jgi:hypothetical protein
MAPCSNTLQAAQCNELASNSTQMRRRDLENSELYKDKNWNENKTEHEEEKKRNRAALG